MSYQGWKNYETWAMVLWMDNDEGLYNLGRELAQEAREEAKEPDQILEAKHILGDKLKDYWEEQMPELDPPWGDLLGGAFSDIHWAEIGDHILAE